MLKAMCMRPPWKSAALIRRYSWNLYSTKYAFSAASITSTPNT